MKKLKPWFRNKGLGWLGLWFLMCSPAGAVPLQAGPYLMTKKAPGLSGGPAMTGGMWSMAAGLGEPFAGAALSHTGYALRSGYYAGFIGAGGTLKLLNSKIGPNAFYQDGLQIGVPLDAAVWLEFSDQVHAGSLSAGVSVTMLMDHLGRPQNSPVAVNFVHNPSTAAVRLSPAPAWRGNTLYEISLTSDLRDLDGFSYSGSERLRFITALNPDEENVVLNPLIPESLRSVPAPLGKAGALHLEIPSQALSEFSFAVVNRDPLNHPIRVNPEIIRDANQKAQAAGGGHARPARIEEIVGFNLQGGMLSRLSRPAALSVAAGEGERPGGLALWALDESHRMWVKIPGSAPGAGGYSVTAPITRFSVYALISGPVGSAADTYVFPNPWRPFGPRAGNGPNQTGTEQAGITFSNLPSECAIRIYTLSGSLVRDLRHSDLSGATGVETWNGLTASGSPAASGVYLWRVESAEDGKNGKLMIIK